MPGQRFVIGRAAHVGKRLVALANLANPQYVTNKIFFSGVHLGMTIDECVVHYGSIPMSHSDPREGGKFVEIRHIPKEAPDEQWRVLIASTLFAGVDAFYSGVYLGMPIDDCIAYYLSGDPPIAERGHVTWDDPHALPGKNW